MFINFIGKILCSVIVSVVLLEVVGFIKNIVLGRFVLFILFMFQGVYC